MADAKIAAYYGNNLKLSSTEEDICFLPNPRSANLTSLEENILQYDLTKLELIILTYTYSLISKIDSIRKYK